MEVIKTLKDIQFQYDTPITISKKKSINGKYGEKFKAYPIGAVTLPDGSVELEYCLKSHKEETKDDLYEIAHSRYTRVHTDVSLVDTWKGGK
jgi:hypothetical protein